MRNDVGDAAGTDSADVQAATAVSTVTTTHADRHTRTGSRSDEPLDQNFTCTGDRLSVSASKYS